jgi:hypothetical protein
MGEAALMETRRLAFGVGCGAAVAQMIWWSAPGAGARLLVALPFLLIGAGLSRGGRHWLVPALVSVSCLLLLVLLTPCPDWEQPPSELPDVTTEFLEVRFLGITAYAIAMLWRLSVRWRLGRSS